MARFFIRNPLSERQERAVARAVDNISLQRLSRFRILACISNTNDIEKSDVLRLAARLAPDDDCDVVILYVRPIDQDLWSGGLQLRLARQNMLDAGLELPGVKLLRRSMDALAQAGIDGRGWTRKNSHQSAWGDPAGDNKVEFCSETGRTIVLKLKTAPDPAAGILDQYELGPYNLIILGEPSRWRSGVNDWFGAGVTQRVTMLAPCSVLVARERRNRAGFFIHTDGSAVANQALRRAAVLAHVIGEPITIFSCAADSDEQEKAQRTVYSASSLLQAMGIHVHNTMTAVGDPALMIAEYGNDHHIIAVADDTKTGVSRIFRRSLAMEVIRRASTSVLDVR